MKPGMPLLLALLRNQHPVAPTEQDWRTSLALAEAEGVLSWFTHLALAVPHPSAIGESLLKAQRDAQVHAFLYTAELTTLLRDFAAAHIPVLLLKGPSLAERLYGSPALRTSRDLDLLVPPEHFAPAQSLLHSLGFTPNYPPDDYHQSLRRSTTTVELHYDVENPLTFSFHTASAWQQAVPATFHGQPAHLFAPADELLYLCLHGTRHRFDRVSHVLDIALALQHFGQPAGLRSQAAAMANILSLGVNLARQLSPGILAPATGPHMESLAETLWSHLLTQPATPADWQALHRFYLELEPTPAARLNRRTRQIRVLAARITQPDRDLAARLGVSYLWAARLLRPFRLLLARLRQTHSGSS